MQPLSFWEATRSSHRKAVRTNLLNTLTIVTKGAILDVQDKDQQVILAELDEWKPVTEYWGQTAKITVRRNT